ncbi:MAG: ADOP family duplicated permease [Bryobacteraceae bacterium]
MLRRFLNLFRPNRLEADIREEIEFHREQSRGSFGNAALIADRMRDASTIAWLETCLQDLRYGFRQLLKSPVVLAVAVLSLALGIGANTAVFTLINAVMVQLLPVRDAARLVLFSDAVSEGTGSGDLIGDELSYPFYQHLRSHNDVFQDLCAFREGEDNVMLHVTGEPDTQVGYASVHLVSGNYFDVLGVNPAAGRLLRDSDDTPASTPVGVMSYGFWKTRFHLTPAILGKTVVLNGTAFTVVGVADASFFGERIRTSPDFWLPLSFQPQIMIREKSLLHTLNTYWLNCMGRLKPGVTFNIAQAAVNARLHSFYIAQVGAHPTAETRHKIEGAQITLKPGGSGISRLRYRYSKPLEVLMAVVALVLLIACANIATLLLARASTRRHEFLCRLALGAARTRLLRQVLSESILLALIGGVAGTLFAWWSVKTLVLLLHFDPVMKVRPDTAVLSFTLVLSIATGIFFGIIPAWKFSHLDPRPGNAAAVTWRTRRFGSTQALICVQIAISLSLLVAAGLLAHSLIALEEQNIGFTRDRILLMRTDADLAGYQPSQYASLYRDITERINQLPGVQSATVARFSPISGYSSSGNFSIQGYRPPAGKDLRVWDLPVGPHFFSTLKIPLLLGRTIDVRDTAGTAPVAVVNQTFVDEYLPGVNPLGQHMEYGDVFKAPGSEIVGVVADSKFFDLREKAKPMTFYPISQKPANSFELILRTAADPNSVAGEVRSALKQIDSRLPALEQHRLNDQIEGSLEQQKMITTLCSIFGLVGLLLASIGIYGTLAYSVAGRTAEIGIRMAIGAQRAHVISLVLRDLAVVLVAGLFLGLPLALGATRWLQSFLFGVKPLDPVALTGSVLLIGAIALLAGYLPAQRAAKIDPMRALRHE